MGYKNNDFKEVKFSINFLNIQLDSDKYREADTYDVKNPDSY